VVTRFEKEVSMRSVLICLPALLGGWGLVCLTPCFEDEGNWPSFRGAGAAGTADGYETAVEWSVEEETNIRWRRDIPGLAHSSPVIEGDRIFVTTAIRLEGEQELRVGLYGDIAPVADSSAFSFELHCLDKNTGEALWAQSCWEGVPKYQRHPKGSFAAPSPACDGERVVAFFGTEGLFCYDLEGELLWEKSLGDLDSGFYVVLAAQWGFSSSPVLHDDLVIVQCDVQGQSFVAALDASTGEERWRADRDEVPTWSTPTVDVREGRSQVICNGFKHIGGYDLRTGAELWRLEGGGDIPVPTPIVVGDLVFVTNAHGRLAPILAIDAMAEGTLTMNAEESEAVVWCLRRRGNYMQTPLAYGEEIYFCSDSGVLSCFDVASGEDLYRERLGSGTTGFTGSGVAADGKLYFCSEEGEVFVVAAGRDFELLAVNDLGEECMSSPAVSEGVLYYRGREFLVAIE
jgi:outer membrane protein assembly factor BamB